MAKTVSLRQLVDEVNRRNEQSTCSPDMRMGWNALLEGILMDRDAYAGFNNLPASKVPAGQLPGIIRGATPQENQYPDESRKVYYLKRGCE